MPTKTSTPKKRTRRTGKKVTVRDLVPRRQTGAVKGGTYSKIAIEYKPQKPDGSTG